MIPVLWLDEVSSTNTFAKEQFLREKRNGTFAVAARRQTDGRGRLGRSWQSEPGQSLALSVLVPRPLAASVTLCVGVAAARAVSRFCDANIQLKWPNDILCNDRKIGGILCQQIVGAESATVLGIGINLAQSAAFFEENGLPYGSSLRLETGASVSPEQMAEAVTEEIEKTLKIFEAQGFAAFKEEYETRCVNVGKEVRILSQASTESSVGVASGVDEDGNLLVTGSDGKSYAVRTGEVSVRGVYGYV